MRVCYDIPELCYKSRILQKLHEQKEADGQHFNSPPDLARLPYLPGLVAMSRQDRGPYWGIQKKKKEMITRQMIYGKVWMVLGSELRDNKEAAVYQSYAVYLWDCFSRLRQNVRRQKMR